MTTENTPTITPARCAKGKVVMHCPTDGSGYKTRAARLAEAFGGRWVHRSHGYVMAPSRAAEVLRLWGINWDAHTRMFTYDKRKTAELLIPPKTYGIDPRDPDPARVGIFRNHNCAQCHDGMKPCKRGNPNQCDYPHARND